MIPKIIHCCWFGNKPFPDSVKRCMESWEKYCPDYKIKIWNEENFNYKSMSFSREAYWLKKYAFVSDVARLYALYNEGGIYLDTDVRLLKGFDMLLSNKSFIGLEAPFRLSTAVIGAEKRCLWIKEFNNLYRYRHFIGINRRGFIKKKPNTLLLTEFFNSNYPNFFDDVNVLDIDFLCAKLYPSGEYYITDNTIAVHEFSGTWK